jgi:hypothetical protein
MMTEPVRIAIARADGGVSIMTIAGIEGDVSAVVAAEIEKWQSTSPVKAIGHWPIPDSAIPADRSFRDAWAQEGNAITVDMTRARSIQLGRIRAARDAKLKALDLPFLRAVETGDSARQAEIAGEKQRLRDLPAATDLSKAATPEALKALWPTELT